MLTPQEIKDQDFQSKFRGFDPIEVKAFLEELADDVFDLAEDNSKLQENFDRVQKEVAEALKEKEALENELSAIKDNSEDIEKKVEDGYRYKDEQINQLNSEVDSLNVELEKLQQEVAANDEQMSKARSQVTEAEQKFAEEQIEADKLRSKVSVLEEQVTELKKEGVDFKSTILVAQKFAEELKEKAEKEAALMLETARKEAEKMRAEMTFEQHTLSNQIEKLAQTKTEIRKDLTTKLSIVLESVKVLDEGGEDLKDSSVVGELDDLDLFNLAPALEESTESGEEKSSTMNEEPGLEFLAVDEEEGSETPDWNRG